MPPGAPQTKDAEREIELTEKVGGWVNLTCDVRGVPRPSVTWSISGSQVTISLSVNVPTATRVIGFGLTHFNALQSWREVVKRETEDQVYSVVMLKVSTDTLAICNSTNDFGIETKAYNIRSSKSLLLKLHLYVHCKNMIGNVLVIFSPVHYLFILQRLTLKHINMV